MHTVNAAQTLDRILGFYKAEQHDQVRARLADNLSAVLVPAAAAARLGQGHGALLRADDLHAAHPRAAGVRRDQRDRAHDRVQRAPRLNSFNQSLRRLVQQKLVELKDALAASDRPDELVLALRGITAGSSRRKREAGEGRPPPRSGGDAVCGCPGNRRRGRSSAPPELADPPLESPPGGSPGGIPGFEPRPGPVSIPLPS